jgi:hypothetical protein
LCAGYATATVAVAVAVVVFAAYETVAVAEAVRYEGSSQGASSLTDQKFHSQILTLGCLVKRKRKAMRFLILILEQEE